MLQRFWTSSIWFVSEDSRLLARLMGAVPSLPRKEGRRQDTSEYLIGTFTGETSYPLSSEFWQKLLESPLTLQWPQDRIIQACQTFARNNCHTKHLVKILIHLTLCLQESICVATESSEAHLKAVNAACLSFVFLKYIIENSKGNIFEELYLCWDEDDAQSDIPKGHDVVSFVMHGLLTYIGGSDFSAQTYLLHHELLGLMLVILSALLRYSSLCPGDVHPFVDSVMSQESAVVCSVVRRLLVNFISPPHIPLPITSLSVLPERKQFGLLEKVGSVAASFVMLSYHKLSTFVSTSGEGTRNPLAVKSLLALLILVHHRRYIVAEETTENVTQNHANQNSQPEKSCFMGNPYCMALENAKDVEFDREDIEENACSGPFVRLPFASLFDALGEGLTDESAVLLLYSLLHGNPDFLEYVLVRTDLDTLLMPVLEMLYDAPRRSSKQIYMLLITLLILSQDSSFNASIHKLILPTVSWYQERLLHNSSLGSLIVVILTRIVKYNLSTQKDTYLHTNCLAILANMAPHIHRLSAYASQRLISLFDILSRKYAKLSKLRNDEILKCKDNNLEGDNVAEAVSTELHIYTDFLRIVLEIINAILTYALPRNPEVVYAIMHRQEIFQPFRSHPFFSELFENIYMVLDFFNGRMDAVQMSDDWSVENVLQMIITISRSWRGEGLKMFTQLRFTYEQESHPEEFFIPYIWELVLSHRDI